jgi:hypothetical protein
MKNKISFNGSLFTWLCSFALFLLISVSNAGATNIQESFMPDTVSLEAGITRADFLALDDEGEAHALVANFTITDLVNIPTIPEIPDPNVIYISAEEFNGSNYETKLKVLKNPELYIVYEN